MVHWNKTTIQIAGILFLSLFIFALVIPRIHSCGGDRFALGAKH